VAIVPPNPSQQVEGDGELEVGGVGIDQIVGTGGWKVVEEFVGEIAMGIEQGEPVSGAEMLQDGIAQEGGFSRAGFADEVRVVAGILGMDAERCFRAPLGARADVDEGWVHAPESASTPGPMGTGCRDSATKG